MPQAVVNTKFYYFSQNNTGGSFRIKPEQGIAEYVIVEATSYKDANARAQHIGLYFDGKATGVDCSCCGSRWYAKYDEDGATEVPSVYGKPVESYADYFASGYYIHYIDGRIVGGKFPKRKD